MLITITSRIWRTSSSDTGAYPSSPWPRLGRAWGFAPGGLTPAQVAIAWVWQQPGVTTVIPGARNLAQARAHAEAGAAGPLSEDLLAGVRSIYDRHVRATVHGRW